MDEIIKRDQNFVTVLAGITNDADQDITMLRVDPISKRLLVAATGGGGGGSPGGPNTSIQFNDSGSFNGFGTWNGTYLSLPNGQAFQGQYTNLLGSAYINPDGSAVFSSGNVIFNNAGVVTFSSLGGGGDQMVIVDNSGILSAQSLPPSGPSIALETNGTPNGDQLTLNLVQGTNMTITDDGLGNVTFDSTGSGSMAIGGSVSGSTPGSILFIDSSNNLAQDNANLFWDASNKRLGIMNNAPAYELDVTGDTYISGHTGLGTTPNSSFDLTVGGDTNFSGSMQVANDVILAYSTGRVSVGTGTPTKPFNVFGDMYLSGAFFDSSLSPGSSGYILSSTGGSTVWISPSTLPAPTISAVLTASSITPVADGTYTVGLGLTQNGTITTQNGIITSVQQAS